MMPTPRCLHRAACSLVSLAACLVAVGYGRAAEDPQPVRYRVTGLFSPDRPDDLRAVMKKLPDVTLVRIDYDRGEASFTYDPAVVFKDARPEQIPERFDKLLRSVSSSTFGIRPLGTVPRDKLQRIEIPVVGLDCKGCSFAAYEAVYKVDGVEQATASFHDGLVTAWIDPTKTDRATLEAALKKKRVQLPAP